MNIWIILYFTGITRFSSLTLVGANENTRIDRDWEIKFRISVNVNWCWLTLDTDLSLTLVPGNAEVNTTWVYLWNRMDIINEVTRDLWQEKWEESMFFFTSRNTGEQLITNSLFVYYILSIFLCNICLYTGLYFLQCIHYSPYYFSEQFLLWRLSVRSLLQAFIIQNLCCSSSKYIIQCIFASLLDDWLSIILRFPVWTVNCKLAFQVYY